MGRVRVLQNILSGFLCSIQQNKGSCPNVHQMLPQFLVVAVPQGVGQIQKTVAGSFHAIVTAQQEGDAPA
jgi:hypothetical protein